MFGHLDFEFGWKLVIGYLTLVFYNLSITKTNLPGLGGSVILKIKWLKTGCSLRERERKKERAGLQP